MIPAYFSAMLALLYDMPFKAGRRSYPVTAPLTEEQKGSLFVKYEKEIAHKSNNIPRKLRHKIKGKK